MSNVEVFDNVVRRDNHADLVFNGELMAAVDNRGESETGRWIELCLYRTDAGKMVCERQRRTSHYDERDVFEAAVCDGTVGVTDFFGFGHLSKQLYKEAGIDTSVFVP